MDLGVTAYIWGVGGPAAMDEGQSVSSASGFPSRR